ncbi:expressed unknown protein [Seminavis robusta]|uniref:Uncharacterized protein n=1 Tax=Seminavis robusta TaxID=568900 RepID=A0A9N8EZV7_9STRA|nr:expressed unknown protein [Seminavis robusta]|eukprot:Sro2143_g316240.1 n/a (506) ;mRNA; f:9412-11214
MTNLKSDFHRILKKRFQSAPRFGYSSTFSDLFSQDNDVSMNYVKGLLAAGLLILIIFLCWVLLLLVFKCLGRRKVGFLSGAPFQAVISSGDAPSVNPWIARGRFTVAFSCVAMVAFAVLLATAGIGNIDTTTTTIGDGATLGYDYFSTAQLRLRLVEEDIVVAKSVRDEAVIEFKEFYTSLRDAGEAYGTGDVEEAIRIVIEGADELHDFIGSEFRSIYGSLGDGQQTCLNVKETTDEIDLRVLQWVVGVIFAFIPAVLYGCFWWMMYQPTSERNAKVEVCTTWFALPLVSLLVVLSIIACSAICVAGLMNSDFCSGGEDQTPDSTIIRIMIEQGSDPDSFEFRAIEYLVSECDFGRLVRGTPLENVEDLESRIDSTLIDIESVLEEIAVIDTEQLSQQIGYNVSAVQVQLLRLREPLEELQGHILEFIHSLACRPLYAAYYTVAHQATCTESYTGLFWAFMSLLWINLFDLELETRKQDALVEAGTGREENNEVVLKPSSEEEC